MMKKIMKRILDRRGETLIESLAAILVFTLASIVFLSLVTGSAEINKKAMEIDTFYQEQLEIAELGNRDDADSVKLVISCTNPDNTTDNLYEGHVDVVGTDLYAYYSQENAGGAG